MAIPEEAARESDAYSREGILCSGLRKDHGQERGLFDLGLEVHAGEVFGFIGPNGADRTAARQRPRRLRR